MLLPITQFSIAQSFWNFCTEHGSDTAVLCAKLQNDWATEAAIIDEQIFLRFQFQMSFKRISYIATAACFPKRKLRIPITVSLFQAMQAITML